MYRKFDTVVKLVINERAKYSSGDQHLFRELQLRARDGNSSVDDWNLLLTRIPSKVFYVTEFEKQATKLSYGSDKVETDNFGKL